jgi:hypothetical protein
MLVDLPARGGGGGPLLRTTSMGALLPPAGMSTALAFSSCPQLQTGAASAGLGGDPAGPAENPQLSLRTRVSVAPSASAAGLASSAMFGFPMTDGVLERYWAGEVDI